jgi:hypothetical protein
LVEEEGRSLPMLLQVCARRASGLFLASSCKEGRGHQGAMHSANVNNSNGRCGHPRTDGIHAW